MNAIVSIILLNYNGAEDTIACIDSLLKNLYTNYNIIIVDNNSSDNSMAEIKSYLQLKTSVFSVFNSPDEAMQSQNTQKKFTLLQTNNNNGYGYGNNIGIKYALKNSADYVLILNNDTIVNSNFLEPMVRMCEKDQDIGIVSGKIYFYDKPDTIWFNGGKFSPCTAKVEHFNFNEKDIGQTPSEPITFISGCMWLIPKKIFNNIGFINEDYFMYVEDLEFCQRVLKKGYTLKVCGDSHILHKAGSASGGHLSSFSVYWTARNKILFITNNITAICKVSAHLYNIFIVPLRWIYKRKYKLFSIHIKGTIDAIK